MIFDAFFDDAAVFPPGRAPLPDAVAAHLARRSTPRGELVGPLVLPLSSVVDAARLAGGADLTVSAVVAPGAAAVVPKVAEELAAAYDSVRIGSAEFKTDATSPDALPAEVEAIARVGVPGWVELASSVVTAEALALLQQHDLGLKFRTGGLTADLFPTPDELVTVIVRAARAGIRFKLTAGLHRAMRYRDADTGFDHFGFANVAAAARAALDGEDAARVTAWLQSDDADQVARSVGTDDAWRRGFASFGTCSIAEPLETLIDLGLLDADLAQPEGHV